MNRFAHRVATVAFVLAVSVLPLRAGEITDGLPEYSVTSWTEAAGRPLGSVYAIVQAGDGYLWIGSDAGLFRFDGWRFTPWAGEGGRGLPSSAPVTVLAARRAGGLWIAFANLPGLYQVSDGRAQVVGDSDKSLLRVTAVTEETDGSLWAVADGALNRFANSKWEHLQVGNETRGTGMFPYLVNVRASESGPLWVTSTEGLFRHTHGAGFERVTGNPNQTRELMGAWVWDVAEAADGSLWTTHLGAGFKQRTSAPAGWQQPAIRAKGYRLLIDRTGNAWVGTIGDGVWRVSAGHGAQRWTVERMTLGTGLSSNSVQSLMEDRDGNVWIGTTAGMHRLTRHKLTPINDIGLVVSVETAPDGSVLVSTFNGLVTFQAGARDLKQRTSAAAGYWIMRVHRDHKNALWVGSTSGLFRSTDGGHTLTPVMPDMLVGSLASDGQGTVWIVVKRQLYRTTPEGRIVHVDVPPSSGITGVTSVFGDSAGRLWVTDADGHLGRMDDAGTLHAVAVGKGVGATGKINTIFEDHDHTLWLGTDKGLGRLVDGNFDLLGPNNGLPSDRIGAITEDDFGCLWLNVDTSLVRLARDEFDRAVHNAGYRPKYTAYDASDGLSGAAIVNLRAARAADGSLWFVRGGGLTLVDPRRLAAMPPHQAHATRIDTIAADDLTVSPANGGTVPAGTKTVQISYSALELTSPQRLRFRYRLDGFDSDWIAAGTVRQARYTNLPPGNYTFRVEAQAAGDGSVDSSAWTFSLEPRFNQTPQFYALIAGGLLALLYAAWRIRLRVVQHEFSIVLAERTRLSREMHDTLLQSLVGLTLQIDKAVRLVRTSPASAADQLVRMRKLVESNIRDARTSIWELRSPVVESRDLVTALSELGQRMVGDENIAFSAEAVGVTRELPANVKTNLLRIGQEAIANALRHAVPTTIAVEVRFEPYGVTLRIVDDGQGFTPHFSGDAAGHYGLLNMRDRAKEIGGVLTISSTPATGSVVEARIPLEEWPLEVRQRTA